MLYLRYTAADHNHVGIKDIDYLRQPARKTILKSLNRGCSFEVTSLEVRNNLLRSPRVAGHSFVVQRNACARYPHLHASAFPAIARRARILLRPRPGQWIVSPFAGDAIQPFVNARAYRNTAAASSSENDAKHHVSACRRAISGLGDGKTVCVVGYANFTVERSS